MTTIISDTFESGSWSASWTSYVGSPEVLAEAALSGSYGLKCDTNNEYLQKDFTAQSFLSVGCLFDPNGVSVSSSLRPFHLPACCYVSLYPNGSSYILTVTARSDTFVWTESDDIVITDASHDIHLEYSGGSPGYVKLWVDTVLEATISVTNISSKPYSIYFGFTFGTGSTGSIYHDNISVTDEPYGVGSASLSPSASTSRSVSRSLSQSPSVSKSASPSLSPSSSGSKSASFSLSQSPSLSISPSPSASRSVSPSISKSPSISPSSSGSRSVSSSVSRSVSRSASRSVSRSASWSFSASPSLSRSVSPSLSPSFSLSISPSASPSLEALSIDIRDEIDSYDWGIQFTDSDGILQVYPPDTFQNGDCLVAIIGKQGGDDITPPAGWTVGAEGIGTDGNDVFGGIYYKFITDVNSEPDPYNDEYYEFVSDGSDEPAGWWCGALTNVSQTNPEDVDFDTGSGDWSYLQNDTSPAAPSVTVATADVLAFACWVVNSDPGVDTFPSSPWIKRAGTVGGNGVLTVFSKYVFVSGESTGTPEIATLMSGQDTEVGTFVFRKAGASPSPSASLSISPSASLSPSRSVSPSVSKSLSPSASLSISPSPSESFSASMSLSPSPSESPSASVSPTMSESESLSISPSFSFSISPSASPSRSLSPSLAPRYRIAAQMM